VLIQEAELKDFEAWLSSWVLDFTYNPRDLFHSEAINGKYNFVSFANHRADSLIDLGTSLARREDAKPVWAEFQRLLAEQQPYTWLYMPSELVGVSRRVRGAETMDTRSHIFDLRHWWVTPSPRS
jgi:peptide/nickel transport system substrate-binding protein